MGPGRFDRMGAGCPARTGASASRSLRGSAAAGRRGRVGDSEHLRRAVLEGDGPGQREQRRSLGIVGGRPRRLVRYGRRRRLSARPHGAVRGRDHRHAGHGRKSFTGRDLSFSSHCRWVGRPVGGSSGRQRRRGWRGRLSNAFHGAAPRLAPVGRCPPGDRRSGDDHVIHHHRRVVPDRRRRPPTRHHAHLRR